jgi:hypothetical protein
MGLTDSVKTTIVRDITPYRVQLYELYEPDR